MTDPHGVLEIKCPASAKEQTLYNLSANSNFFLYQTNDHLQLKTSHKYYYQVQGQMRITKRAWCDFVVWTPRASDLHIERIFYQPDLWDTTMYPKLRKFYFCSMLPELASPRYHSCKNVRDTLDLALDTDL